jgi:hypothetical protein
MRIHSHPAHRNVKDEPQPERPSTPEAEERTRRWLAELGLDECERQPDGPGYWICHRCGSLWSDMLAGTGWHPLSCPKHHR